MEENKEVVEETTQQENPVKEEPKVDDKVEKLKVKEKPKMKKFNQQSDDIIKVDLSKPPKTEKDADTKQEATDVADDKQAETVQEVVEEIPSEQTTVQDEDTPVVEEVTDEKVEEKVEEVKEQVEEAVAVAEATGKPLPENIQKLIDFMEETGGDIADYVNLNRDYSKLDDVALLREYYTQTKPHLNSEEIDFMMQDMFNYDEEADDDVDIKRKKLALKEQVANAKSQLEENKSKYYEDIKATKLVNPKQQEAVDFFNRYNKESEENEKVAKGMQEIFTRKTDEVFNDKFKGFEYKVGEKKFRYNVSNAEQVKNTQSDVNNFVGKFLDENYTMKDAPGYHKALYTAMNADAIANHFYEQGKSDAMKDSVAKAKNVDMKPRQSHKKVETSGVKYKVLGDDSSDFKFKIKNRK